MKNKIALFSFTNKGKNLCDKIEKLELFENDEFFKVETPSMVKNYVKENFHNLDLLIFVGAIGIALRFIKDCIKSKDTDPAVIVLDENGEFVIPILSGHLGGGNEFAVNIAKELNSTPVITTATDINKKFAVDIFAKKNNLEIANINCIKNISSKILRDEGVNFHSDFEVDNDFPFPINKDEKTGISISLNAEKKPFETTLNLVPKVIFVGVGCKKNTESDLFEEFVLRVLKENEISLLAVSKIASINIKSKEKAILDFCEKYNLESEFYSAEELNSLIGDFTGSEFVKSITGVDNVCERSAVLSSENGDLIVKKQSENGITIALAKKEWSCTF